MVFFEPIFIRSHSLKPQQVDGFQIGIHFYKSLRVEQILNPLPGRLRKVIVAAWTDALICASSISGTTSEQPGHFWKRPRGMSRFLPPPVLIAGFLKIAMRLMRVPP